MSEDDVRAMIRRKAKPFAYEGSTGVTAWGRRQHNIQRGHLSEFMNGHRAPTTAILDALGLEWRICRKRKTT